MRLYEDSFESTLDLEGPLLGQLERAVKGRFEESLLPIRLVVTRCGDGRAFCEIGLAADLDLARIATTPSIFNIRRRVVENTSAFIAVVIVPTGVGAEVGVMRGTQPRSSAFLGRLPTL